MVDILEILDKIKKPEKLKDYSVKTYQDSDYFNLIELYNIVFPNLKLNNFIKWKNKKNPFGIGDEYTFLLKDKSILVAQYTVVPKIFYIYGKKVPCIQSTGTMTHPEYQKLGISTYLAKLNYEYSMRNKKHFVYGYPNGNSISTR